MADDHQQTDQESDDAYLRVKVACEQLLPKRYPSVASVQAYLKDHLGGGIKTARISALIRRWETETKSAKRVTKAPPEPPTPGIDETLESNPDLTPVVETMLAALAKVLAGRAEAEAAARVQAVAAAIETAKDSATRREVETAAAHAAELAERETVIEQLRAEQAALVDEIAALREAAADRDMAMERAGQDLALAKSEARTASGRAADLEARLTAAESREGAAGEARLQLAALVDGLRADVAAERQRSDGLHERIEQLTRELATATTAKQS